MLLLAFRLALGELRGGVESALGPRGSVGHVSVGWTGVELRDVRIRAERGGKRPWPAEDGSLTCCASANPVFAAAQST